MLAIQRQPLTKSPYFVGTALFVSSFVVVAAFLHIYAPRNAAPQDSSLISQLLHESNNSSIIPKTLTVETAAATSPAVEASSGTVYSTGKSKTVAQPTKQTETIPAPTPTDPPATPPVVEDPPLPPEDPPPTGDPSDPPPTDP